MNEALRILPPNKQEELQYLIDLLGASKEVEMVILLGSYAHGEHVEDTYVEEGTLYEYKSDYDMLVVTRRHDLVANIKLETQVNETLRDTGRVKTPISLIFHSGRHLNQAFREGNYFFQGIKMEGILLYDTGKVRLQNPKKLTVEGARQKVQGYFNQWFESANGFLKQFKYALQDEEFHMVAFQLHKGD